MDTYQIQEIPSNQKYWFFRTEGGTYFSDFYLNGFIAYGWNNLCDFDHILNTKHDDLKEEFKKLYPEEKRPGLAINQMITFINKMNIGDIVIIPSAASEHIGIGIISSNPYLATDPYSLNSDTFLDDDKNDAEDIGYKKCPYKKRREVNWIKTIPQKRIDPYLFKLMCAVNTISDASYYASFIDRIVYPIYLKDNQVHLTLRVEKKEKISAIDVANLINGIINLLDFSDDASLQTDLNSLELRINVQSPGVIEFIGGSLVVCIICSALSLVATGAEINFTVPGVVDFSVKSEGAIEKYLKYKKEENDHEIQLKETMGKLQVQLPSNKAYPEVIENK